MVKYTIERLLLAFITTFIIVTLTFFLMKLLPFPIIIGKEADVISYLMNEKAKGNLVLTTYSLQEASTITDDAVKSMQAATGWVYNSSDKTQWFYQASAWNQYCVWITNIFTKFEFGTSTKIMKNVDAIAIINMKIGTTVKVNIWSVILSVPLGILLGIWAALKKNKMTDHIISTLVMVFISIPSFITITFLLDIFAYNNGQILPSQWPGEGADIKQKFLAYIIPVLSLSFGSICGYCRFTRAELTEVMSSDFLLLARTKGLTKSQTITRHAMKNAMVPILPSILAEFIGILGGSMILEQLYGIPGVGKLYIESISKNDYNVLLADMTFYTVIGLVAGVFLDLSYGFIDPRIRMGAKK
jgi:oligopeptide transport system permease protein